MTTIPIGRVQVDAASRRRRLDQGKVSELADSIQQLGLLNPITILPGGRLVAGYHRYEACKLLGWRDIPVNTVELSGLDAELAEIDENLVRNDLSELEHGQHLQRRKEIYEALHPEAKVGGDRKSDEAKSKRNDFVLIPSFSEDTAAKTGRSARSIQQGVQIATKITPEVQEKIRDHDLADSKTELLKLSRLEPTAQAAVAERITAGQAERVDEALGQILEAEIISELTTGIAEQLAADEREPVEARPLGPTQEQLRQVATFRQSGGASRDVLASGMFSSIRRLACAPLSAHDFKQELSITAPAMLEAARAHCPAVRALIDEIERAGL